MNISDIPYLENISDIPYLDSIGDILVSLLQHQALFAPFLLLLVEESGIPIPVPGDIVVTYLGYQVAKGTIPYYLAFIELLAAVMIGSSVLYYLSSKYGQQIVLKVGKYIHLDEKKLVIVEQYFQKYGFLVIIFGRHIPGFRVPITIFSGMSNLSYKTFILSTFISVVFWILLYLSIGEKLGPRAIQLLNGHQQYFALVFLPFAIFIFSIIFVQVKKKFSKEKKAKDTKKVKHS